MTNVTQLRCTSNLPTALRAWAFVTVLLVATILILTEDAQAQTFTVLHNFTGGADGSNPMAGLTEDAAGNLYGTTTFGGYHYGPGGTVFRLVRYSSSWLVEVLYAFHGSDGAQPTARVIFGPDGTLYGTTSWGNGNVFNVRPPASTCSSSVCLWTETVIYAFTPGSSGYLPGTGDLIFDSAGHLYGTTRAGGDYGNGVVFELSPGSGSWTEDVLYSFYQPAITGYAPFAGVIFDLQGNIFGTTPIGEGNASAGAVYELMPSSNGWTAQSLQSFMGGEAGGILYGGLIRDPEGNLYGTASTGGLNNGGTVFELSPTNGGWTFATIWNLSGNDGSYASLTLDALGNLYGTTLEGGAYYRGNVFKLSPSNGGWTYTSLHDFMGGGSDGAGPESSVTVDRNGNLYGTTVAGGLYGDGVVWEITP